MSDLRYTKNLALLGALESAYGVEQTTFTAANAVLLTEQPKHEMQWLNVDRDLVTPYFGVSEQLQATALVKTTFKTELVASGIAGTPPAIGPWLIACGMQETITAGDRVVYSPLSQNTGSITQRFNNDGVRYISKGGRGKFKLDLSVMNRPTIEFELWSIARVESVQAMPAVDYGAFKIPEVVTDAASGDIRFGTTLTAGNVTGGTAYKSKGVTIDYANALEHFPLLGGEAIGISDRKVTGKIQVALDEATEVQWFQDVKTIATTTMSFVHGSTAGKKIVVHGRRVQRYNMNRMDEKGRLMFAADLGFVPEGADNEIQLIFK